MNATIFESAEWGGGGGGGGGGGCLFLKRGGGQLVDFGKNVGVCNFSIWLKESSIDTGVYTS